MTDVRVQDEDPTELVRLAHRALSRHLSWACSLQTVLVQLFRDDEANEVWRELCSFAMATVRAAVARELILAVCRMNDSGDRSCTFRRLARLLDEDGRADLALRFRKKLTTLEKLEDKAMRRVRNDEIGHLDFEKTLRGDYHLAIPAGDVDEALRIARELLEEVRAEYLSIGVAIGGPVGRADPEDGEFKSLVDLPGYGFKPLVDLLKAVRAGERPEWPDTNRFLL